MKIIAVAFDRKNKYRNLLKVFLRSAAKIMPSVEIDLIRCRAPRKISRKHDMAYAFNVAAERAIESKTECIICDIDLLFIKSIEDAFTLFNFDIAVTVRTKYKYNTGLWFYRPTYNAECFVKKWIENTREMMRHPKQEDYQKMIADYAGIDQASLALTCQQNNIVSVLELPCTDWNSCQGEWKDFNPSTRVLHVKSALRGVAMNKRVPKPGYEYIEPLAKLWRAYL